jgi:hypothetical protein
MAHHQARVAELADALDLGFSDGLREPTDSLTQAWRAFSGVYPAANNDKFPLIANRLR